MSFYEALSDATGSKTLANCLKVCGYNSFSDFQNFNGSSIKDVEKYISNLCFSLPKEKRLKLIDPIFINHPELFAFQPAMKTKLLSFVESQLAMGQLFEMSGNFNANIGNESDSIWIDSLLNDTPSSSDRKSLSIEEIVEEPENNSNRRLSNRNKEDGRDEAPLPIKKVKITTLANNGIVDVKDNSSTASLKDYDLASTEVHQVVIDRAFLKFVDCAINIGTDFSLYQKTHDKTSGLFLCKLASNNPKHVEKINVPFTENGLPCFNNIHNHLRSHFDMKASRKSNSSVNAKRKSGHSKDFLEEIKD